jgi:hypothetical protein
MDRACEIQKGLSMDSSGAVSSAVTQFSQGNSGLAVVALKSAEKEQSSVLQLFSSANVAPPSESGRGQHVNTTA